MCRFNVLTGRDTPALRNAGVSLPVRTLNLHKLVSFISNIAFISNMQYTVHIGMTNDNEKGQTDGTIQPCYG
jgi:hypothetical protein